MGKNTNLKRNSAVKLEESAEHVDCGMQPVLSLEKAQTHHNSSTDYIPLANQRAPDKTKCECFTLSCNSAR